MNINKALIALALGLALTACNKDQAATDAAAPAADTAAAAPADAAAPAAGHHVYGAQMRVA